jgi:hypothetical protein
MLFKFSLGMKLLVALFTSVWEVVRSFQLQAVDSENMLPPANMLPQVAFIPMHFIAVAAMVSQCFLVGVFSTAVTTEMRSRVRDFPYMIKLLSSIWKVFITLPTIAVICNLLMVLQVCQPKKSSFTLLALWMLVMIMLEDVFPKEKEVAKVATE